MNLPIWTKDMYSETKIWMREIKDDTNREIYHVIGLEEHCENDYTTQSNLQFQCKPYQITSGIFHRIRTKFYNFMETQTTMNSPSNLQK